jgi:hypothetical protein
MSRPRLTALRPLTGAEREARRRQKRAAEWERWRAALERIATSTTAREARRLAAEALACPGKERAPQ